jgi:ligand-binding sensor domain-containing protein
VGGTEGRHPALPQGRFRLLTSRDGLHEQYVYSIVADTAGRFWMDSNRGVYHVRVAELHDVAEGRRERIRCTVFEGPTR